MAQDNEWWKNGSTQIQSAGSDWWTHGATPVDAQPPTGGTASDLAKSVKAGVQRLPGMATGLADLPFALAAGARPFTKAADALGEATGFQPGKWADETKFSAGYEQGKKAVDEAWKDGSAGDIALSYLKNPGYTANQVAESLPGMVAGGVAGRALMGVGRVAGVAADAAAGTAARAAVPGLAERTLGAWAAPVAAGVGEGAVTAGQQMAQYQGDDQQKNALASLGAGVGTGLIGVGAGRVANKLGLETAETAIAKAGTGAAKAADEVPLSAKRRILGGMVSEAVLQELPQSAQEQMWQNWADGKPLMEGVARAATEGAIAGGVMGAGANVSDGGAGKRRAQAEQQARQNAEAAAASAEALTQETLNAKPLMLGSSAPDRLYVFPDGTVGRTGEVESYLASLPEEQRAEARAKLMGQLYTEVNDPQAQQARRWWENYGDGQAVQPPDYLAEVQQAVRSGTPFTTQQTVETVRSAMEDAWLAQNVGAAADAAPPAQAADTVGAQLQGAFDQAGEDAALAAVDARVRTGRILAGLQNILDAGGEGAAQVLGRLNEGLARINEAPLAADESARVRRMLDARAAFTGQTTPSPLPDTAPRAVDAYADNTAMEALIPERPSQRMGIDPAAGPLSKEAATAVDAGTAAAPLASLAAQSQFTANAPANGDVLQQVAEPAAQAQAAINSEATFPQSTAGESNGAQADQAQQAVPQPAQAGAAQAGAPAAQGLSNGAAQTFDTGAQAAPQAGPQAQAQGAETGAAAAVPVEAPRPSNWRTSMLGARPVANSLGIESKGKRLAQVVAEIDAADAQRAGTTGGAGQQAPSVAPQGREVSRDIGRYKEGLSEYRANQVRSELARQNPGVVYTVEEDAALKNGYAVVGREPAPGAKLGMERLKAAQGRAPLQFSRGLRKATDFVPNADGGLDYGEITPEMSKAMRRQAGAIRLQQGVQNPDGTGYGLRHIEANHGQQIRNAGFDSVEDFVAHISHNFNEVLQAAKGSQLLAAVSTGRRDVMFVQLEAAQDGDFYRVNTAFPASRDYLEKQEGKGAKILWSGSEPRSAATGRQPPYAGNPEVVSGQDAPIARGENSKQSWSRVPVPADNAGAPSSFADQAAGNAGQQAAMESSQSDASVPPQDGNAKFSRAGDQTQTPEFKRWFGDSKVVDADGKPLVVYHGGTVGNVFDAAHSGTGSGREGGFFFTPDIRQARDYAGSADVKSVFLSIKNPLFTDRQLDPDEVAQAKADGYDGYWLIEDGLVEESEIVTFLPEQIKSATGNNGQFNPANPDIRYSHSMSEELARKLVRLPRPATKESVHAAVRKLVNGLGMLPNRLGRVVVATAAEIKQDWEPLIGPTGMEAAGDAGQAQGFYDPKTKTVFLVADHIKAGDEMGVVAHELMHKHGQAVLGEEGWNRLHGMIDGWASAADGSMERRVYDEAAARVRDSRPEGADAVGYSSQELFPYAVQVALEMGVKPSLLAKPGTVARWLGQVRAALREVWDKITRKPDLFNAQDLVNLAFGIAQRENPAHSSELDAAASPPASGTGKANSESQGVQFSRSAAAAPAADDYTPAQRRAAEHAFGVQKKQTWAERAQSFRANLGTKLRQGLVDQFAPLKEVSDKAYMLARMSKGSDGAVEAALLYGKVFLRDGVYDVDIKDGGFAKVLATLKGEDVRFFQWVAAQRAERLKAEGKENLLTDQDITALKSLNAGRFTDGTPRMGVYAQALKELNAFNDSTLKVAVESGLIDQAAYELMKEQPYVPFYRLMEEDGGMRGPRFSSGLVNQQAWKKLKGGTQQLNADLLQNTLMNWSHLYAAAARNRASLETMAAAEKLGIAYQVSADTKGAVKVMRDGVAEHWVVEDPYLLDAISAMSYTPPGIVKAMAPFKRLLTFGVTVNPTFKIRNLIRDSLSAIAQSDLSYNPAENVAKGWKATSKNSQTYASMLASGGIIKFGTQEDTNRVRAQIEKLGGQVLDKSGFERFKGQMKSLWEVYEEFGDRTENVNRAALYERLIAKGHSHAEASFMARDLMDFSMSGKWETVRFLAQTVPFLNARLQGLYKLGRAANEDPRRFVAMAGAVSLASLGLLAAYGDDDDWKKREDWDRDNFWWFKVGDKAFRIPKPFEVGAIGTLAERTAELMLSDEMTGKRFGQRISDMVFNTFAMDPTPQAIKPFLDVYANKDSFSGRAIEGMADERLRPQDRYNERTSEVARLLGSWGLPDPVRLAKGEYKGLSPKQIDFLLRGYFGWLATVSTTTTDMLSRPLLDRGERPAMRLRDTFLAGNFVESLPTGSSRYVTTMYEQAKEVEQAWASHQAAIKSGDIELARSIQEEEGPKLRNRFAVANAKQQIAELGQQAKKIEGNRVMSAEAKRARLDEIEARKNVIAQRVTH